MRHDLSDLGAGAWAACDHPERPPDANTVYEDTCRACVLHAITGLRAGLLPPSQVTIDHDDGDHQPNSVWIPHAAAALGIDAGAPR